MGTASITALMRGKSRVLGYRLSYGELTYDIGGDMMHDIMLAPHEASNTLQLVSFNGTLVTKLEMDSGICVEEISDFSRAISFLQVIRCSKAGVPSKYLDLLFADTFKKDRVKGVADRYLKATKFKDPKTREFLYKVIARGVRISDEAFNMYDTTGVEDFASRLNNLVGIVPFKRICESDVVYLDTETTGLGDDDEIIELGITDNNGTVLYSCMFKPTKTPHPMALKVNGITLEELSVAVDFKCEMQKINNILKGRVICTYNKDFDKRLVHQTIKRYFGLQVASQYTGVWFSNSICAMQSYMAFNSTGSSFISLVNACKQMGVVHEQLHRATDDCIMTMKLCKEVAEKESCQSFVSCLSTTRTLK